jgi:hypothetical protein
MIHTEQALAYRRLRVPREHGGVLVDPPLDAVAELVAANRAAAIERGDYNCQGRTLADLSAQARRELLLRARRYTRAYRDVDASVPDEADGLLFLSGHQPELFHTGVWLKNLALGSLADRHDATGIHLLIDNDAARKTALQVPTGSPERASLQSVPMDKPMAAVPYETRRIVDRELFASFGSRVQSTLAPLVCESMIGDFWPSVVEAARENDNLGQCLSRARHQLEGQWGYKTLELPLSHVCRTDAYHWLLTHLLARAEEIHQVYNSSLAEYRAAFRLRSRTHPVPDLTRRDEFVELPFWVWTAADPRRRPLFVRRGRKRTVLRDLQSVEVDLAVYPERDAAAAVDQLRALTDQGIALRPRALMTTLLIRVLLGDLFIHGIGGARYDQLTDLLILRFFRGRPPRFLTVTGTALFDIPHERVEIEDIRRVDRLLRELTFHPDRHIEDLDVPPGDAGRVSQIIDSKRFWIHQQPPRGRRRARHEAIVRANEQLQPLVAGRRSQLVAERSRLREGLRNHRILAAREYAFCLLPEQPLRDWCLDLLPPTS